MKINPNTIDDETALYRDYLEFLERGKSLIGRFEGIGHTVPHALLRLRGEAPPDRAETLQIERPKTPVAPPAGYTQDHLYAPVDHANTQVKSLVLALLRAAGAAVPVQDLCTQVLESRPDASRGSVANIGTALAKLGLIERSAAGWRLLKPEAAPLMAGGYLWGPAAVFGTSEIAWWRRQVILHLLSLMPGGLQPQQITDHLQNVTWVRVPKDKDIIKMDLESLKKDRLIRRISSSRKWVPVTKEAP